jgi:hypothetical protein
MPRFASIFDGLGIAGSLLCAVHCLLLPLLIPLVPMFGMLASDSVHEWLVALLAAPALLAAWSGHRRHGRGELVVLFVFGVLMLLVAAWFAEEGTETALTLIGGAVLISAHGINRYLCRTCLRCDDASDCRHAT